MKGYTLVEMLVALVILGTLAGGLNLAFHTSLDANERAHQQVDTSQETRLVLNVIRADIEQAALTSDSDRSWFIGGDENDGTNDNDTLRLISRSRRVPLNDVQEDAEWESAPHDADWSAVVYRLNPSGDDDTVGLYRREVTPPGEDPYETDDDEDPGECLSPSVVGLNFRYFDGTDWLDEWDSTSTDGNENALPRAVEVTLTFRPQAGEKNGRAVTAVFPLRALPPETTEQDSNNTTDSGANASE